MVQAGGIALLAHGRNEMPCSSSGKTANFYRLRYRRVKPAPVATLTSMGHLENAILKNLDVFVGFARSRVGDHHLAEDVVHDSLVKALAADRQPDTDEETTNIRY